jgi:hypothetical protein
MHRDVAENRFPTNQERTGYDKEKHPFAGQEPVNQKAKVKQQKEGKQKSQIGEKHARIG